MQNKPRPAYQMLMLITTPQQVLKAEELFKKENLPIQYRVSAEGTASSEIMDLLGLGSTDKSVIFSMLPKSVAEEMLEKLHAKLRLDSVNSGIACTIPLTGASHIILHILSKIAQATPDEERKEDPSMTDKKNTLITAIVNRGFNGDVMNAARTAGATGGTLLHSRMVGDEELAGLWGMQPEEEKEIVYILAKAENKLEIMRAISEKCGINSDAKGIVFSIPVDEVMGF